MADTRLDDMLKLIDRVLSKNPYDPRSQKNLWLIWNMGLLKGILARLAVNDWILRQELEQRARHEVSRTPKPPV